MCDKGHSGYFHGTQGDRTDGGQHRIVNGISSKIDADSQGKHIPNHKNYIPGRSVMHGSMQHIQELADTYAGTGIMHPNGRETVDFGQIIGTHVNQETGERKPTTIGTIHYSKKKNACHIVPSLPKKGV